MEALRQIASTSLFLENEQNNIENNRIIPIIKEPDKGNYRILYHSKVKAPIQISGIFSPQKFHLK